MDSQQALYHHLDLIADMRQELTSLRILALDVRINTIKKKTIHDKDHRTNLITVYLSSVSNYSYTYLTIYVYFLTL